MLDLGSKVEAVDRTRRAGDAVEMRVRVKAALCGAESGSSTRSGTSSREDGEGKESQVEEMRLKPKERTGTRGGDAEG